MRSKCEKEERRRELEKGLMKEIKREKGERFFMLNLDDLMMIW